MKKLFFADCLPQAAGVMRVVLPVLVVLLLLVTGCGNKPPSVPIVLGAVRGRPGDSLWFSALSVDPEADSIAYLFHWGDGGETGWSDWYPPGEEWRAAHAFGDSGFYGVVAKAKDAGHETGWSDSFPVEVREFGPWTPSRPSGRDTVPLGDTVLFLTKANHPLGERIAIQFDWGDTLGCWGGFAEPGSIIKGYHVFYSGGIFEVKARAKDSLEHLSGWSKPESVLVIDTFRLAQ